MIPEAIQIDPSEPCAECGVAAYEHDAIDTGDCDEWRLFPKVPVPYVPHPLGEWEQRQLGTDGGDE